MAEQTPRQAWVDCYIRHRMSVEGMAEFESVLMESAGLQRELETVLGLREALFLESRQNPGSASHTPAY